MNTTAPHVPGETPAHDPQQLANRATSAAPSDPRRRARPALPVRANDLRRRQLRHGQHQLPGVEAPPKSGEPVVQSDGSFRAQRRGLGTLERADATTPSINQEERTPTQSGAQRRTPRCKAQSAAPPFHRDKRDRLVVRCRRCARCRLAKQWPAAPGARQR